MIFLGSCKTKIICNEISRSQVKPLIWCDLAFKPNPRCRCRCFDVNNNTTLEDSKCGEAFKSGNFHIQRCDEIAGPVKTDWVKHIRPKLKRLANIKDQYCK